MSTAPDHRWEPGRGPFPPRPDEAEDKANWIPPEDYERVEHPHHYNAHPSGVECVQIVQWMTFNVGTAVKHLWRIGLKPGSAEIEDLRKARQYLAYEIERLGGTP